MNTIVWKNVPFKGYEHKYEISTDGKLRNKQTNNILKEQKDRAGYVMYDLTYEKKRKRRPAHRLVALAFLPNFYGKKQVNHKNGNKKDNRIINLEWCTGKYNVRHAVDNKLLIAPNKKKILQYSIDNKFIKEHKSLASAARSVGLKTYSSISTVCNGRGKTCKGFIWKFKTEQKSGSKYVLQYSKDNKFIKEFNSVREAARHVNGGAGNICQCCKGTRKTYKGFIWKYK